MRSSQWMLFSNHPHVTYTGLSAILSIFSLGPTPGMIPIIITLSTLLVYSRKIFPTYAPHTGRHATALWASLTIGGSIPRFRASIHALSQPYTSIASLFLLSGITSFLAIGALYVETKASSWCRSDSIRLLLFPAVWTTFWAIIAAFSPLGTLSTWSPIEGTGAYDWLTPIFGPGSLNWIVAAWAVVVSQALMSLYMGPRDDEDDSHLGLLVPTESNGHGHHVNASAIRGILTEKNKTVLLAAVLVLLTVPSYIENSLPLPLGDVSKVTPVVVGCALPTIDEYKVHEFKFEHFLAESKRLDNTANFILWPEGAVRFNSEKERNNALEEVRRKVNHAFVGVAFEETLDDTENPDNRYGVRRTGIAIVSNKSTTPHLLYYKRHLVPIAESFSLAHSRAPPTTFSAEITYPKRIPVSGHKRDIPVTSSICLDFSAPSLFGDLDVRPGLILAPARTWDVTVGYTMWKQASQRAHEIGSIVLWCDGGEGGVSGVAGHGYNEVVQVGSGSWVRTIGLEFPFDEDSRTLYAHYGNYALLLFCGLSIGFPIGQRGGRWLCSVIWQRGGNFVRSVVERFRRNEVTSSPPVGNLIDDL